MDKKDLIIHISRNNTQIEKTKLLEMSLEALAMIFIQTEIEAMNKKTNIAL
ncbi:MAG: hypothetical protein IPJ32_04495 [Sphingobacteriaceae bacterium]|nr:hypothetical protein [Sphingobacteriaceae bacterium]